MDIVAIDGDPIAKRGKQSGRKMLWRCKSCFVSQTTPHQPGMDAPGCPDCGISMTPLLESVKEPDFPMAPHSNHDTVRELVLMQLQNISLEFDKK